MLKVSMISRQVSISIDMMACRLVDVLARVEPDDDSFAIGAAKVSITYFFF